MSLRFRINLINAVVIVLFCLVTAKIKILDDMRSSIREEMEAGTKVTQQLLSAVRYAVSSLPDRTIRSASCSRSCTVSGECVHTRSAYTRTTAVWYTPRLHLCTRRAALRPSGSRAWFRRVCPRRS
jgi:hypothetical protein